MDRWGRVNGFRLWKSGVMAQGDLFGCADYWGERVAYLG